MSLSEKFKKLKEQKTEELEAPKPEIQKVPKEVLPVKEDIEIKKKARISNIVGYESDIIPNIDFTALANTSDFKRLIFLAITGKVWRGTNAGLEISLNNKLKKLNGSEQKK